MKILALDTSGLVCSCALCEDDRLIARFSVQNKKTHSQMLLPMMADLRDKAELDLSSLDAVAVAAGPGSFTGLRIGAATAKGLGLALDKPLVAVPTLEALACNLYGMEGLVCPIMDARRKQVYCGIYRWEKEDCGNGKEHAFRLAVMKDQAALSVADLAAILNERGEQVTFLGDGVPVYREALYSLLTVPFSFAPFPMNRQDAACVAMRASALFKAGETVTADAFAPIYLRPTQAAQNRLKIRKMEEKDIEGAASLEQTNFTKPWTRDQLEEAARREDTVYLVAAEGERIVGLCGVQNISGDGSITNVQVLEKRRGRGIGGKLMRALLSHGRALGILNFTLEVRASNLAARRLYESLGFTCDGLRPGFYDAPKEDAAIYWLRDKDIEKERLN